MKRLYDYVDYRTLVLDAIEHHPKGRRGQRKQMADAANCQLSHITAVLSGTADFSLEQAEAVARYFDFNRKEIEFFLTLVLRQRAASPNLKRFFDQTIEDIKAKQSDLKHRLTIEEDVPGHNQVQYYSSWIYAAVHVLISTPKFRTAKSIAARLALSTEQVEGILNFLTTAGLIEKKDKSYRQIKPLLHLKSSSHLIAQHHTNWRLQSILSLSRDKKDNLHYSGVVTLSAKHFALVRSVLEQALAESVEIIKAAPEEEAAVLNLDMFWL